MFYPDKKKHRYQTSAKPKKVQHRRTQSLLFYPETCKKTVNRLGPKFTGCRLKNEK